MIVIRPERGSSASRRKEVFKWLIAAAAPLARPLAELLLGHVVRRLAQYLERLPGVEPLHGALPPPDDPVPPEL